MNMLPPPPGTRRTAFAALSLAGVVALAACSGGGTDGDAEYVDGGTFVFALASDLGALDPHLAITGSGLNAARFAYDQLVGLDADNTIVSNLASDWSVDGTTVTLTLRDDVTCADGSAFTASTAAANIDFIADPANASPLLAVYVPAGVTTDADDDTGTLTLTLASPAPFVLEGLAGVPMVCEAGLADRSLLASETQGTGAYVLTEAVANDRYTYEVRDGYTWGPDGASTDEEGLPAVVELRIVPNETTLANLLLSGEVNAGSVLGPDAARLEPLFSVENRAVTGEQWFNHAPGNVTAELAVRTALTQALDLDELANVITSGEGERATQLAVVEPTTCQGGDFTAAFPAFDPDAAAQALEQAGWTEGAGGVRERDGRPLSISFIHDSALGSGGAAAAELAVAAWTEIGIDVQASTLPTDELAGILFGGGSWDVVWEPLNVNSPDQIVGLISGPPPAEGGSNFASIANEAYDAGVADAMSLIGADSCDAWFAAEEALVADLDVLPFANTVQSLYGSGAEFRWPGTIDPTSIRMTR
ncbi:ABC transporter substrate-binding protein [Microbacterium sp. 18062]|uniref:ABC transporter substrate-binding protein n=1 Tax=Microbacterium sp. 18062 TaxID=2681410 RepID=UPI00135CA81A|nr:ABC transporter substrate-binding protein [Microbacterium sp. 18062]